MNAVLIVVMVLLGGLALVVGGTGLLALAGRLPGNDYLGVRTPETRRDPEAWRIANRGAGPAFLAAGAMLALGTLGVGLIGGWIGALVVVVALIGALALLNVAGLAGARAAAIWQATRDDDEEGCGCGSGSCGGGAHPGTDGSSGAGGCSPSEAHNAGQSGCSSPTTEATDSADPAADCGVTGGCGSCALQGMCESESISRR